MLTFDEEKHEYRWKGIIVPSVTQIINEWCHVRGFYVNTFNPRICIDEEVFDERREEGKAIHLVLKLEILNTLDWTSLAENYVAVLRQFLKWKEEWNPEIRGVEEKLYSVKYHFAGTLDLPCVIKRRPAIVDFKTGAFTMAGPQISGYEQLDKESDNSRIKRDRYVLWLPPDGSTHKFIPLKDKDDWAFFLSRLTQYNYLKRH